MHAPAPAFDRQQPAIPHVMLVIAQLSMGGAERQLTLLVKELATRCRFTVVAYDNLTRAAYADDLRTAGAEVVLLKRQAGIRGKVQFLRDLMSLMRAHNPDVIHTWLVSANFWGLLAARLVNMQGRTIASIRNTKEFHSVRFERVLQHLIARWASRIISNTRAARQILVNNGVPSEKLSVIPNGIVPELYLCTEPRIEVRQSLGLPATAIIVGTVGRLEEQKNHKMFIAAARRVHETLPNTHFLIVGEGRLRGELEQQIAAEGMRDAVTILAARRDMPRVFRALDVFVLTSDWEGFPNVIMESMCACVPVVATNVGGVGELVQADVTGLLINARDTAALGEALQQLVGEPDLRAKLSAAAKSHIEANCTLWRMAESTEAEYRTVIAGYRTP